MNKLQRSWFQDYFYGLSIVDRKRFAKRAKTTVNNIYVNWMRRQDKCHPEHVKNFQSTNTQPKSKTMLVLSKATRGGCDYEDMLDHFYRK